MEYICPTRTGKLSNPSWDSSRGFESHLLHQTHLSQLFSADGSYTYFHSARIYTRSQSNFIERDTVSHGPRVRRARNAETSSSKASPQCQIPESFPTSRSISSTLSVFLVAECTAVIS